MAADITRLNANVPTDLYREVEQARGVITWAEVIRQALRLWVEREQAAVTGRKERRG